MSRNSKLGAAVPVIHTLEQNTDTHNKDPPTYGNDEKSEKVKWKEGVLKVEDLRRTSRQNTVKFHHLVF
jgi:hypothetical protein